MNCALHWNPSGSILSYSEGLQPESNIHDVLLPSDRRHILLAVPTFDKVYLMKINHYLGKVGGKVGYDYDIAGFQPVSSQFQDAL